MIIDAHLLLYPLLKVAIMLILGVVAADVAHGIVHTPVWEWAFVVSVVAALAAWRLRRRFWLQIFAIYISFFLLGALRFGAYADSLSWKALPHAENYEAVVASSPVVKGHTTRYEIVVTKGRLAGKRVYAYMPASQERLSVGDGLVAFSEFRPNPSNRRWLLVHGIAGNTYIGAGNWCRSVVGLECLSGVERIKICLMPLRKQLLGMIGTRLFSPESYAVVAAMTLGDKSAIDVSLREVYSVSGASHILALSGMHIGIIFALFTMLLKRWTSKLFGYALVIVAIWGYIFMVGMPVSAVRSGMMFTLFALLTLLGRQGVPLNTLSLVAMIIVIGSPMSLWDISFQMSFMAVASILLLYSKIMRVMSYDSQKRHPILKWVVSLAAVSVSAQIGVAPLVAYYFGRFSCYFILSNFIAIPLAMLIIYFSLALYAAFFCPWLQNLMVVIVERLVAMLNGGLSFVASLPGASIEHIHISLVQLLLVYLALALLYASLPYFRKMYHSAYGYMLRRLFKE